jgi:hypothetical protein
MRIEREIEMLRAELRDVVAWERVTVKTLTRWCERCPSWLPFRTLLIRRWAHKIKAIEESNLQQQYLTRIAELEAAWTKKNLTPNDSLPRLRTLKRFARL